MVGLDLYWTLVTIILGLIVGSFLTVCIYRIPFGSLEEELAGDNTDIQQPPAESKPTITLVEPKRSFCPSCNNRLLWWHNIPLVSWLLLRGQCAYCKKSIPVRYPLVELLTALLSLWSFSMFGITPTGFLIFAFCCALLVITFIDYDFYIIPNVISLPGTALGLAIGLFNQYFHLFNFPVASSLTISLFGILAGAGFLFLVSEVYFRLRKLEGLGMGDVKLLAMTGAFFGPGCALYTIFVGSLIGSVSGVLMVLFLRRKMSQHLPFGPYLALGTFI